MNLTSAPDISIAVVGKPNSGKKSLLRSLNATTAPDNAAKATLNFKGKELVFHCTSFEDISYKRIISSSEFAIVVLDANKIPDDEALKIFSDLKKINIPFFIAVNKIECGVNQKLLTSLKKAKVLHYEISCKENAGIERLKAGLLRQLPGDKSSSLLENVLYAGDTALLIVPASFDKQASPYTKLIEEFKINKIKTAIVRENELKQFIIYLQTEPDLVVCEIENVRDISNALSYSTKITSYEILNSYTNNTLLPFINGLKALEIIKDGDKVLITEGGMSHRPTDSTHKNIISLWLKKNVARNLHVITCSTNDFPENLSDYKLVIQCKGCNLTGKEIKSRVNQLLLSDIPVVNSEVLLAYIYGAVPRVILPFKEALTTLAEIQMFPGFLPATHF